MKKIFLLIILSSSLASNVFGMDWLNPYSYFAEKSIGLQFAFDDTSKKQLAGFLTLMVNTGEAMPDGAENHAVQVYQTMQEVGFDGLVKKPKFDECFNKYLAELKKNPNFKKAEHDHSKKVWEQVCWNMAFMLKEKAGIEFPNGQGDGFAEEFLKLNAHLPETSKMALMTGALLQLVPGQIQREEAQKE